MNRELCEYPHPGKLSCGREVSWESEFGKKYCSAHHGQVLLNRDYMFKMWEEIENEKIMGHPVGIVLGSRYGESAT